MDKAKLVEAIESFFNAQWSRMWVSVTDSEIGVDGMFNPADLADAIIAAQTDQTTKPDPQLESALRLAL